jgi:hypothetical protein
VQIAKKYNIQLLPIVYKNNPANDLGNPDQQDQYKQWLTSSVQHFTGTPMGPHSLLTVIV